MKQERRGGPEPKALLLASASGVLLYAVATVTGRSYGAAMLLGGPILVGLVAGLTSVRRPYLNTLLATLLLLVLSVVTLREGIACVLFVLPLLLLMTLVGTYGGRAIREEVVDARRRLVIGIVLVLLVVGWQLLESYFDDPRAHPLHEASDAVVIAAPPQVVFARLTQRPLELPERWQWFMRLGLPVARRLEVLEARVGGAVLMEQSFGTVRARIRELEPGSTLAYDVESYDVHDPPFFITRLGRGPHFGLRPERVDDWLTIVSTRYELRPLPDGHTELTRKMSWRRHLAPGFYFAPLQQAVIERGQRRLLELIRETVEREGRRSEGVARH